MVQRQCFLAEGCLWGDKAAPDIFNDSFCTAVQRAEAMVVEEFPADEADLTGHLELYEEPTPMALTGFADDLRRLHIHREGAEQAANRVCRYNEAYEGGGKVFGAVVACGWFL